MNRTTFTILLLEDCIFPENCFRHIMQILLELVLDHHYELKTIIFLKHLVIIPTRVTSPSEVTISKI